MRFITPVFSHFLSRVLVLIALLASTSTYAVTPTQAQIEQFKRLPKQQQEAIARQYGIDMSVLSGNTAASAETMVVTETIASRSLEKNAENERTIERTAAKTLDTTTLSDKQEEKVVQQKLEQFGYELFAGSPSTFAPVTDIPVSMDYVVGPGDTVQVQLYGKENSQLQLAVNREGQINFPNIGPLNLAGMSFAEMKTFLQDTVARQMIGVKASITLGELRSIRVFVLGDAHRPGSYTVSSLSTITNALFVSGGITKIGSLRNIQLKRKGEVIAAMDLYDLLLKGDTRDDRRLLPGDVIFIPPIGKTVGVAGEVKRPAIYELKNEKTAEELVNLAGGYLATAYPQASRIERIDSNGNRTLLDIDLTNSAMLNTVPHNGDVLQIFSVLEKMENVVLLKGHVNRPGGFAWKKGLRLSDIVSGYEDLLPSPELRIGVIVRESEQERNLQVAYFSPKQALHLPKSAHDPLLNARDTVLLFGANQPRADLLRQILDQLKQQVSYHEPAAIVSIQGHARFGGEYPYQPGMMLRDVLNAAGGLSLEADLQYALLVRRAHNKSRILVEQIGLSEEVLDKTVLHAGDTLLTFGVQESREAILKPVVEQLTAQANDKEPMQLVSVEGSVRFPGTYPLTNNMQVEDLLVAAGGYVEKAYNQSAEITRTKVETGTLRKIYKRLQLDLTDPLALGVTLDSRDQLFVKSIPNWSESAAITISGEVRFPGVYPIYKGDSLYDVLQRAGGLTSYGYAPGAVFTREELRLQEEKRLQELRDRLAGDILKTQLSMQNDVSADEKKVSSMQEVAQAQALLAQLDTTKAVGRMVIDLQRVLKGEDSYLIDVKDGDRLYVPQQNNAVTIIGEVQYPTSQHYIKGKSHKDYLSLSGGLTTKADDERVYIVKADGSVKLPSTGFLFFPGAGEVVDPGDTIVVPLDTDRVNQRILWRDMSQIFYQIALGAAAVGSF